MIRYLGILLLIAFASTGSAQTTPPDVKNKTITIDVPTTVWPGWESGLIDADPNPPATRPASMDEYTAFPTPPKERASFSGKVVGLSSYADVEVTVISVFPREYFSHDATVTTVVRPDGSFAIKAQDHPERPKTICVRVPGRPWTYLNHDFAPNESGRDIVLRPQEGKKITVTATLDGSSEKKWMTLEAFDGHQRRDREGKPVMSEYYGGRDGNEGTATIILPLRPMALRVRVEGSANTCVMVDPREVDHLTVRLPREARMTARITKHGKPYTFRPVWFYNPTSRLSWGGVETDGKGDFELRGLMPGQYLFITEDGPFTSMLRQGRTNDVTFNLTP